MASKVDSRSLAWGKRVALEYNRGGRTLQFGRDYAEIISMVKDLIRERHVPNNPLAAPQSQILAFIRNLKINGLPKRPLHQLARLSKGTLSNNSNGQSHLTVIVESRGGGGDGEGSSVQQSEQQQKLQEVLDKIQQTGIELMHQKQLAKMEKKISKKAKKALFKPNISQTSNQQSQQNEYLVQRQKCVQTFSSSQQQQDNIKQTINSILHSMQKQNIDSKKLSEVLPAFCEKIKQLKQLYKVEHLSDIQFLQFLRQTKTQGKNQLNQQINNNQSGNVNSQFIQQNQEKNIQNYQISQLNQDNQILNGNSWLISQSQEKINQNQHVSQLNEDNQKQNGNNQLVSQNQFKNSQNQYVSQINEENVTFNTQQADLNDNKNKLDVYQDDSNKFQFQSEERTQNFEQPEFQTSNGQVLNFVETKEDFQSQQWQIQQNNLNQGQFQAEEGSGNLTQHEFQTSNQQFVKFVDTEKDFQSQQSQKIPSPFLNASNAPNYFENQSNIIQSQPQNSQFEFGVYTQNSYVPISRKQQQMAPSFSNAPNASNTCNEFEKETNKIQNQFEFRVDAQNDDSVPISGNQSPTSFSIVFDSQFAAKNYGADKNSEQQMSPFNNFNLSIQQFDQKKNQSSFYTNEHQSDLQFENKQLSSKDDMQNFDGALEEEQTQFEAPKQLESFAPKKISPQKYCVVKQKLFEQFSEDFKKQVFGVIEGQLVEFLHQKQGSAEVALVQDFLQFQMNSLLQHLISESFDVLDVLQKSTQFQVGQCEVVLRPQETEQDDGKISVGTQVEQVNLEVDQNLDEVFAGSQEFNCQGQVLAGARDEEQSADLKAGQEPGFKRQIDLISAEILALRNKISEIEGQEDEEESPSPKRQKLSTDNSAEFSFQPLDSVAANDRSEITISQFQSRKESQNNADNVLVFDNLNRTQQQSPQQNFVTFYSNTNFVKNENTPNKSSNSFNFKENQFLKDSQRFLGHHSQDSVQNSNYTFSKQQQQQQQFLRLNQQLAQNNNNSLYRENIFDKQIQIKQESVEADGFIQQERANDIDYNDFNNTNNYDISQNQFELDISEQLQLNELLRQQQILHSCEQNDANNFTVLNSKIDVSHENITKNVLLSNKAHLQDKKINEQQQQIQQQQEQLQQFQSQEQPSQRINLQNKVGRKVNGKKFIRSTVTRKKIK